jgi:proteasome lid subunit RPN8/RPN11
MTVIIPKQVYQTIVAASVRFANTRILKDDWLEVYGTFIGKVEEDNVIISKAYPITHQEKKPEDIIDKVYWNEEDYASFAEIDDVAFNNNEFTVGWWHSHPGFKVMMSQLDVKTTLSYQTYNPNAISLVFNPTRLIRQVELAEKKGNPDKQLKNDPGFKIFRLDDINRGIEASYHEVGYEIHGFDSKEQLVSKIQKFVIEVTNFFPKDNIFETYDKFIKGKMSELESKIQGTTEYLVTLKRKGEENRITEVLENQKKDIRHFVAETFIEIENIKEFMNYLEYKERKQIVPKVQEILAQWDENVSTLNERLEEISKKFK